MSDWIKVHRRLLDSDIFENQTTLKIWVWLLLKANFKDKLTSLKTGKGYEDVMVKRGKVLFGRTTASSKLKLSEGCVRNHIKKLEKLGKITVKTTNHYSIITICKYDFYQISDEVLSQPNVQPNVQPNIQPNVQPNVLPKATSKNDKECKEDNIIKITPLIYPKKESYNGLPDQYFENLWRTVRATKNIEIDREPVNDLWEVFKDQYLNGENQYPNENDVYRHFVNWAAKKSFKKKLPTKEQKEVTPLTADKATIKNMRENFKPIRE